MNKDTIMMALVSVLVVYLLQVSYNSVVPNITKSGSLKLGRITWMQALSLMVVCSILLKRQFKGLKSVKNKW